MVELDIGDERLHRTLRVVLSTAPSPLAHTRISDRSEQPCDVLVVGVTPTSCRAAVRALTEGRVHGVLCADTPDELPELLDALGRGWRLIPRRVLTAALGSELDR